MKHSVIHALLLVLLIAALLLGACTAPPPAQTPRASLSEGDTSSPSLPTGQAQTLEIDWFQPSDFIWSYWEVELQEDPLPGVLLTAVGRGNSQPKKLVFLFTGKAPLFDRSVSVIMSSFFNKGILVDAAVLYAEDNDTGLDAI